ncbi:hypothetical protein BDQ17DRAFT_1426150 [Cyathus striatus]|nr:hypothetical protein BDQ17DRAFT_1426150 [Cyathus striatus]
MFLRRPRSATAFAFVVIGSAEVFYRIIGEYFFVSEDVPPPSPLRLVLSPLKNVMIILIESGLMYTLSIVILFGLYMASNNGQYGVSNAVVKIIGITFTFIITSVDRGDATQPSSTTLTHSIFCTHPTTSTSVPLHLINIHMTLTRYPPERDSNLNHAAKSPGPESDATQQHTRTSDGCDDPCKFPVEDAEN